jgi:lysophospholipase
VGEPPIAQALMLPGYAGLAEEDFPAANALVARRIQVWALDEIGQGGSGRMTSVRDLGYVRDFTADVAAISAMTGQVIRPGPAQALVAIADGTAAPVALRAAQRDPSAFAALVLTQPASEPKVRVITPDPVNRWLGLDRRRPTGETGWRREDVGGPPGSLPWLRQVWRLANPDLRMGGPSLAWLAAFDRLTQAVRKTGMKGLSLPVLVLVDPAAPAGERAQASRLCAALPRCALSPVSPDQWPAREGDFVAGVAGVHAPARAPALSMAASDR